MAAVMRDVVAYAMQQQGYGAAVRLLKLLQVVDDLDDAQRIRLAAMIEPSEPVDPSPLGQLFARLHDLVSWLCLDGEDRILGDLLEEWAADVKHEDR